MGNITFLGVEGSGKTVLTMALVNLFKAHEAEGWFLRPETRSAFRFVEQVPPVLEPGSLPHQTTELRHLAMSVVKDGEVQRVFDILDYPGEIYRLAFLDAKDDPDPATFQARVEANQEEIRALLGHLQGSDRVYVLFNLADAQDLAHNAQNLDAVWVTNACLDYLHRLPSHPEIALLLTQIDLYGNFDDPNLNPRRIAQEALPLIANNFPNLSIQAVSALGPASGPFGVDNILANCLKDTPAVQAYRALDLNAALDDFLNHSNRFAKVPDAWVFAVAQKSAQVLATDFSKYRQSYSWFCKPAINKIELQQIEKILEDWAHFEAQYKAHSKSFFDSEEALPIFTPQTSAGEGWLRLCREAYEVFCKEEQKNIEMCAHIEAQRARRKSVVYRSVEIVTSSLFAFLFCFSPILVTFCLHGVSLPYWRCWIYESFGCVFYPWQWLSHRLVELDAPGEYESIVCAAGIESNDATMILLVYIWMVLGCLLVAYALIGIKRLKVFWTNVEKRRNVVVLLGGVVTLWFVLFTLLLA